MQSQKSLMKSLMLCASLSAASACATKVSTRPAYPSAADLSVEAKPQAGLEILTSAAAAAKHDIAIESWGERGWKAVGRLCRQIEAWEEGKQLPVDCPAPR